MRMTLVAGAVLLLAVCVFSGCATYWYQEGKTFKQTRDDLAACQTAVEQRADGGSGRTLDAYDGKQVRQGMKERGYRRVSGNALPAGVLRESSPVFGVPGVAGTVN
ncbi:MAG: hypothetical protein KBE65_19870 [Phycisphaerae bacterium]|nr:hypothetical protein [Phycisphaerae bacterium]